MIVVSCEPEIRQQPDDGQPYDHTYHSLVFNLVARLRCNECEGAGDLTVRSRSVSADHDTEFGIKQDLVRNIERMVTDLAVRRDCGWCGRTSALPAAGDHGLPRLRQLAAAVTHESVVAARRRFIEREVAADRDRLLAEPG